MKNVAAGPPEHWPFILTIYDEGLQYILDSEVWFEDQHRRSEGNRMSEARRRFVDKVSFPCVRSRSQGAGKAGPTRCRGADECVIGRVPD
jgi:hypothetical protein